VMRGVAAKQAIAGASEALANFIEAFGTLVIVVVIGFWVGHATRSVAWGMIVGGLGVAGSILSLVVRAREGLDRSLASIRPRTATSRPSRGSVLEGSLEVPEDIREAARHLSAAERDEA
jgi:hypothetical protein